MYRKIIVQAHDRDLAAWADAMRFADLEHALGLGDCLAIVAQAAPAHQKPGPFELVTGLHDAALLTFKRHPVMAEEFA
ncbi:hypothetical protein D3C87_1300230 [compost metagenome]